MLFCMFDPCIHQLLESLSQFKLGTSEDRSDGPHGKISTWRSVEQYGKKSWTHKRQSSSAEPVVIVFPEVEWPSYQNHWWFTAYCSLWYISADWSGFFHGTMTCHWAWFAFLVIVLWQIQEKLTNAVRRYCSESITAKNSKSRHMSDFTVSAF